MKRSSPFTLRHIALWLFLALTAIFLIKQLGELREVKDTLLAGSVSWIVVGLALQASYYYILTDISATSLRIVGIGRTVRELLPLVLGSLIINVLAPTGGIAGAGLLIHDASSRQESAAKAGSGALLSVLASYSSFIPFLLLALGLLTVQHEIRAYQILGGLLLLGLVGALYLAFRLATQRRSVIRHILHGIDRIAHSLAWTFRRPPFLKKGWIDETMRELAEAGEAMRTEPALVARAITLGLVGYVVNILSFAAIFLAFQIPLVPTWVIAGYAVSLLFWIVAPAPQGVGIEEAIMGAVLISVGVPAPQAIAVSIAFRGVHFWLPLLAGIGLFLRHQHQQADTAASPLAIPSVATKLPDSKRQSD